VTFGGPAASDGGSRRHNGLSAPTFVPLADVDVELGQRLLDALARARIAAYLEPGAAAGRDRLFVAADERRDARTIVVSASRAAGRQDTAAALTVPDPFQGRDTDAEFRAIVDDWHIDTVAAIRSAEGDFAREDADWRARITPTPADPDEDEHYVPPPPPPLPRLAGFTLWALTIVGLSIVLLAAGTAIGLPSDLSFLLGVGGILVGAGMLVMRMREHPADEGDDGAML
jgi:hypothetical protein